MFDERELSILDYWKKNVIKSEYLKKMQYHAYYRTFSAYQKSR